MMCAATPTPGEASTSLTLPVLAHHQFQHSSHCVLRILACLRCWPLVVHRPHAHWAAMHTL